MGQSTTIFPCIGPFSAWRRTTKQTKNWVIIVQACSWLVWEGSLLQKYLHNIPVKIKKIISQVSQPLAEDVLDLVEGRGHTLKSSSLLLCCEFDRFWYLFRLYSCCISYLHLFCSLNETNFDHLKIIFPLWPSWSTWESKSALYVFMDILKKMKDKVYVWRDGRDMRAPKRGRERTSSQSVEGREGLVGGVGHRQRVPVMEWTS